MARYRVTIKKRGEHPQDYTEYKIIVEAQALSLAGSEALKVMESNGKSYFGDVDIKRVEELS